MVANGSAYEILTLEDDSETEPRARAAKTGFEGAPDPSR